MRTLLIVTICLACTACGPVFYEPAANQSETNSLIYTNGTPALRANVDGVDVSVLLTSPSGVSGWLDVNIFLRNTSDSLLTFFPEQINVYGYNASGESRRLKVFSAQQFIRRRNTNTAILVGATLAAGVAVGVADARSASPTVGPAVENGAVLHSLNSLNNTLDWWWIWAASSSLSAQNAQLTTSSFQAPFVAPDRLLRRHTMYYSESVQGVVKVRHRDTFEEKLVVEVPINGQFARFEFGPAQRLR